MRYAPLGERGMMAGSRAAEFGKVPAAEHMAASNREITLAIMIEELSALDEIDEIASTEGVDLVVVGPADMSRALGVPGQTDHPKLVETINHVADVVKKSGVTRLALPMGERRLSAQRGATARARRGLRELRAHAGGAAPEGAAGAGGRGAQAAVGRRAGAAEGRCLRTPFATEGTIPPPTEGVDAQSAGVGRRTFAQPAQSKLWAESRKTRRIR